MGKKSTRQRHTRRDRRLAKASDFSRPGKTKNTKVGHGAGTVGCGVGNVKAAKVKKEPKIKLASDKPLTQKLFKEDT